MHRISSRSSSRPSRLPSPAPAPSEAPASDPTRIYAGLTIGVLAMGLVWRFARLVAGYPAWYDEAFVAVTWMTRDFAGLLRPPEYFQIAPLGFLAAEKAMTLAFGASELSLRALPFLAGVASLLLFARLARRTLDPTSTVLAIAIFAAAYYPARHGAEIKPYALDLLFALAAIDLGWSTWLDRESTRRWALLTAELAVGSWFSFPLTFVAIGVGSMLALRVARAPTPKLVACLVGLAVVSGSSWLAMYRTVARPQAVAASFYPGSSTWKAAFPPWDRPARMPAWLLDVHTGNMLAFPYGGNHHGSIVTAALVVVGCFALRRSRPALLGLLLIPLGLTFVASSFHRYPYGTSARTMLFMAPAFCLLAGVGLSTLIRRHLPPHREVRAVALVTVGLGLTMVGSTVGNLALPYREVGDVENRKVVRELAALARPGDAWIGFDGVRQIEPSVDLMSEHWIGQAAEVRYNILAHAPVPVRWMPDRPEVGGTTGRTWLIVHRSGYKAFDERGLDRLMTSLKDELGPPRVRRFQLTPTVSIVAYEFARSGRPAASTSTAG